MNFAGPEQTSRALKDVELSSVVMGVSDIRGVNICVFTPCFVLNMPAAWFPRETPVAEGFSWAAARENRTGRTRPRESNAIVYLFMIRYYPDPI
jgi:hypothetical protein